jgi:SNF2 family DNA or RNA helicase
VSTLEPVDASVALAPDLPPELEAYRPLVRALQAGRGTSPTVTGLVDEAVALWARPGFDAFISLPRLGFEPLPYQLQAAATALRRMHARAILADDVGLGKTIEAGLALSELRLRGLADRALVVAPAALVGQWQEELDRKFALPSVVADRGSWDQARGFGERPVVIVSSSAAVRSPLRAAIVGERWDLVVVDEAHRVKSGRSAAGRLVRALTTRHLLLLTATPMEDALDDLFQLVNLVRPGHLGSAEGFRARHGSSGAAESVRNLTELRARLRDVMVRHRRTDVPVRLPRRLTETVHVVPAPAEADLYARISARVRQEAGGAPADRAVALQAVQRLAGSSLRALAPLLDDVGWADLAREARALPEPEKAGVLLQLLRENEARSDKVVVFTGFRETLEVLAGLTAAAGIHAAVYHDQLGRDDKDVAIRAFAADASVLVTTEEAGGGRPLQFCQAMVNFDLPWDPVELEQRLGRLDRIGQPEDVTVTNLVTRGTLEQRLLRMLETSVGLSSELVVGDLVPVLARIDEDLDFEALVFGAHAASADDEELGGRLAALADDLARARAAYQAGRARTDQLVAAAAG